MVVFCDTCNACRTYNSNVDTSDSDSDGDPHLGSFAPIRRCLKRHSHADKSTSKSVLAYEPELVESNALGDFKRLISFLRTKGDFPNHPPLSITSVEKIVEKHSAAHVHPSKHASLLSNTSDSTATRTTTLSGYHTPPSSPDKIDAEIDRIIKGYKIRYKPKEVRWTGSVAGGRDSEDEDRDQNSFAPRYNLRESTIAQRSSQYLKLIPSSINIPPPIPNTKPDRSVIRPIYNLTLDEKKSKLIDKLSRDFPNEPSIRMIPARITSLEINIAHDGIHVFVDLSNILIGFYNQLKFERGMKRIDQIKQPPWSFSILAIVLERGRQVARRVLAGSTTTKEGSSSLTPGHIGEAKSCGYELNILERVRKQKEVKKYGHRHKRIIGSGGYSSASDSTGAMAYANTEQAVDEILHLKMMESIVDIQKPSTMVVASGDAAQAEYSGGFLKMILRALRHNWKVEVVSWKENISHEYTSLSFLKAWGDQFKVVYLDDYCEEMLALYTEKFNYDGMST